MIIDAHTHIGSFGDKEHTAQELAESMERSGIAYSLVIAQPFDSSKKGRGDTAYVLQAAKQYPQLKPIGFVDANNLTASRIQELKDLLSDGKIFGLKVFLGYMSVHANDERLHPLYRFCEERGYPIIFHTGLLAQELTGFLKYSHPLNVDDVATLFRDLKIVIAHFGNPWILDAAAVAAQNKNVYVDLSGFFTEHERISEGEIKDFQEQMRLFVNVAANLEKCLFGSDWWLYDQKEYVDAVQTLPLTGKEKELVFSENARNLFQIGG